MQTKATSHPAHAFGSQEPESSAAIGVASAITAGDLADLLGAFNEASVRLQQSHEALRGEVARLKTELAEANEQIERGRRLAALGEMAAGISHEIRNPLGSIRLYARMLEQDLADRPAERSVATKVARAVSGLDAVVGDVLAFAREMRPNIELHSVSDLLDRAVDESIGGVEGSNQIRVLRLDRTRDDFTIFADAQLLHRALVNVLRNAAEAIREHASAGPSKQGPSAMEATGQLDGTQGPVATNETDSRHAVGTIVIDTLAGTRAKAESRTQPWRSIVVRDTGGGLSEEAMRRMFNPFFTTRAVGTGLGLAIVHRIIDAHAGAVSVRNQPAEAVNGLKLEAGARIELSLPGESRADASDPNLTRSDRDARQRTQLNVDSGKAARGVIGAMVMEDR